MITRPIIIIAVLLCGYLPVEGQYSYLSRIKEAAVLMPAKPVEADSVYREILEEITSQQLADDSLYVLTYFQLGTSNLYQGKLNLALDYYNKSLQHNQRKILPKQSLASLVNSAIIFEKQYRFAEASQKYRKALEFSEQIKDSVSIAGIWLNLGILSHRMKDDEKAVEILNKTYAYYSARRDTLTMGNILNNIATCYFPANPRIAEENLNKSLALYRLVNDEYYVAITTNNIAELHNSQKNFNESRQLLLDNIAFCEKKGFLEALSVAYRLLGQCEIESGGDLGAAAANLEKSRELAQKTGRTDHLRDIREAELLLQARSGNFEGVKKVLEAYKTMLDESAQENARIVNTEFQTIHEVKTLTRQKDMLEEGISLKNRQLILSLLALLAAALAIGIIASQYIRLRRTMRTMYRMNVELANSAVISLRGLKQDTIHDENSELTEEENINLSNLYLDVLRRIEHDKLYLDPLFSLQELSEKIKRSPRYISQAVSEVGNTNFPNLLNSFRINEARRLIAGNQQISVHEIMEKTGFRSRQSFHRNFKSATGFTPKEYREMSAGFRPDESEG
ncbi:MAG: helix-turn-helix domain-containing protein [Bacteroidota bacterium]